MRLTLSKFNNFFDALEQPIIEGYKQGKAQFVDTINQLDSSSLSKCFMVLEAEDAVVIGFVCNQKTFEAIKQQSPESVNSDLENPMIWTADFVLSEDIKDNEFVLVADQKGKGSYTITVEETEDGKVLRSEFKKSEDNNIPDGQVKIVVKAFKFN